MHRQAKVPARRKRAKKMLFSDAEAVLSAPLVEVKTLTAQMVLAGAAGEWSRVEALDQQRYAVLCELPAPTDEAHAAVLREILAATDALTALATRARAAEQTTLDALRRGQRSVGRYLEHADSR